MTPADLDRIEFHADYDTPASPEDARALCAALREAWVDRDLSALDRAFPPGALKPEWEGNPAHVQTVSATDKQIDGFNESADPVEWVVYFTNPKTGARAQMFAVLRPYPEMREPSKTVPCEVAVLKTGTGKTHRWCWPHGQLESMCKKEKP